jgi:hypothetical protein
MVMGDKKKKMAVTILIPSIAAGHDRDFCSLLVSRVGQSLGSDGYKHPRNDVH